jgi:hypothetical protein
VPFSLLHGILGAGARDCGWRGSCPGEQYVWGQGLHRLVRAMRTRFHDIDVDMVLVRLGAVGCVGTGDGHAHKKKKSINPNNFFNPNSTWR